MHWLIPFIQHAAAPLMPAMQALIPAIAAAAHRRVESGDSMVAAFIVSTGLIGLFCILLTSWLLGRLRRCKDRARNDRAVAEAAQSFREALLTGAAEGVVVLRSGSQARQYYGDGKALYEACLDSVQPGKIVRAIDALSEDGTAFEHSAATERGLLSLRGMPVGARAVLYFDRKNAQADQQPYKEILEALPIPVWMRVAGNAIGWANRAFLSTLGFASLQDAVGANAALDWSERDLAMQALRDRHAVEGRASVIMNGAPRVFSMALTPMSETAVAGFAVDMTENARLESRLQRAGDTQDDMIQRLPFAAALFDADQKLVSYNARYADLWEFPRHWLDANPSYGQILDSLRDRRRLPEQRNFAEWKLAQIQSFSQADRRNNEFWHLPNGKDLRVVTEPHLQGGVLVLFEDITERLQLESSLNLLTQVQKATLDTLDEGIAIFGTDGRLVLHNALFATMWKISESELSGQPHFAEIAQLCTTRIGHDGIWGIVSCGINSATPEQFGEWGKARRADGRLISLALSRLPNGATVATFTDITDLEKFGTLTSDASYAAA